MKHRAGKKLTLTDYLSRHPTEGAMNEKVHDEEYLINMVSGPFKKTIKTANSSTRTKNLDQPTNQQT